MTVESTTRRAQYDTNGTTGPWTVPFYFLANADLEVIHTDAAGLETTLTLTTHYSVTGAGVPSGGAVTTVSSYASGGTITVLRSVAILQETDYVETDAFPAAAHETALDRLTMIAQQQGEALDRALTFPASDEVSGTLPPAATRANRLLAFDGTGAPEESPFTTTQVASAIAAAYTGMGTADAAAYLAAGTGSVATTVQQRLRQKVSVFDFMTAAQIADVQAGTIALDVSSCVQAAIDYVKARGGGIVWFPFGRYRCDTTIRLQNTTASNAHVSLIGEGGGNSFVPNSATGSIIVGNTGGVALDCAGASSVTMRDIGVMCGATLSNQSTIGILFQRTASGVTCQEVVMENVSVGMSSKPAANGGLGTIALANKRGEHWSCNHIKLYADIPLLMDGASNYTGVVSPDYAEYTAAGTTLTLLSFKDCLFLSSTGDAVVMTSSGGVTFDACYWYAPVGFSGLNVKFCYNLTYSGQIEGGASNFVKVIGNSNNFFGTMQAPTPGAMVGILCSGANLNGFDLNFRGGFGNILSGQFFGGTVTYDASAGHTLNLTGGSAGIVTVGGTTAPANSFLGGVNFGNAAIADPYAMDWYEEITFTPTIVGTGTAGTGTYTYQAGRAQRVGNRVNFTISLIWTAHTGTGNMTVSGLPYASASINANMAWACSTAYSLLAIGAGKELGAVVNNASSSVTLYAQDQAGGAIAALPIDAAGSLYLSGSYEV